MRRFLVPLVLAVGVLLCSLGGCKTVLGPTPPPGTPGFVNCSETAIHDGALRLLPSIEAAVASGSYEAALASIIATEGGPLVVAEVECAVAWVAQHAALAETATGDSIEAAKASHARAWLAAHPVQFQ